MSFSMKINLNCYYISQTQIMRKPFPCVLISIIAMLSFLGFGRSVGKQSYSQTQNHTKIVLDTFCLKVMSFSIKINHNCHYISQVQIKRKNISLCTDFNKCNVSFLGTPFMSCKDYLFINWTRITHSQHQLRVNLFLAQHQ